MKRRLIAGTINRYPAEPGWVNVHLDRSDRELYDLEHRRMSGSPEIVADLAGELDFPEGFDEVRCHQVLEHLTPKQAAAALRNLFAALLHGGKLDLEVPDINRIVRAHVAGELPWEEMLSNLYGQATTMPDDHLMAHRWGWSETTLRGAVATAGFEEIERLDDDGTASQIRLVAVRP